MKRRLPLLRTLVCRETYVIPVCLCDVLIRENSIIRILVVSNRLTWIYLSLQSCCSVQCCPFQHLRDDSLRLSILQSRRDGSEVHVRADQANARFVLLRSIELRQSTACNIHDISGFMRHFRCRFVLFYRFIVNVIHLSFSSLLSFVSVYMLLLYKKEKN